MEDNELILKSQKGEKEAFQQLISMYYPYVLKFLTKISEDISVAEDLTQETFIKIIRNIDKFDIYGKAKFSTYIITVSRNCYIDYLRKEKNILHSVDIDTLLDVADSKNNVEDTVLANIKSKEINEKLESLTDEQKFVVKLKYIEGMTLKEIGERLELQPRTVKSKIHNAMTKLRRILGKDEENEPY